MYQLLPNNIQKSILTLLTTTFLMQFFNWYSNRNLNIKDKNKANDKQ